VKFMKTRNVGNVRKRPTASDGLGFVEERRRGRYGVIDWVVFTIIFRIAKMPED